MNAMELHRFIFSRLLTIGVARILDWRGPNHKSHAMTLSEIFKREIFLWNKDFVDLLYVQQRRSKAVAWFAKMLKMEMSKLGDVLNKLV